MFSKQLTCLLLVYEFCGFQTGIFKRRIFTVSFFIFHIILALTFTISALSIFVLLINSSERIIIAISYIEHYSSALIAYWLIIFESYFQRKSTQQFWILFAQLNKINLSQKINRIYIRGHVIRILIFFTICYRYLFTTFLFVQYIVLVSICQMRVFYYDFYLNIIEMELQSIENELISINLKFKRFEQFRINEQFLKIRKLYHLIFEMTNRICVIFGWSYLATILFCFHCFLTELDYSYSHFHVVESISKIYK